MATYILHNWSVTERNDPYLPPEVCQRCLAGYRNGEERPVITSRIVEVKGRTVTTLSGSTYILDNISADYLAWMQKNGVPYDPNEPIKVRDK